MKITLPFAALLCLVLFSFTALAQIGDGQPVFAQMRNNPMIQQAMKTGTKTAIRSFWDGNGSNLMFFGVLQDTEVRSALGVTDQQFQEIQNTQRTIGVQMMNSPEYQKHMQEMQAMSPGMLQDPDEETMKKFLDLQGKVTTMMMNSMSEAVDNALSAETKQKFKESQLAIMGEMPIVAPNMFEALNLSDDQKQQMEKIKKELEPDFEKNLESFASGTVVIANKMFDVIEKEGGFGNIVGDPATAQDRQGEIQEQIREKMQGIQKKLMEDPEVKKLSDEMQAAGKVFATQFKTKMFDVLTDEQWKRLQELTDNPPVFAQIFLKKMKEQRGEREKGASGWQPSADSWKPGDAIPEEYRQQRNTPGRFPRGN